MCSKNLYIIYNFVAITVAFNQSRYFDDESTGVVRPKLMLSNPSSTDIIVNMFELANGEY